MLVHLVMGGITLYVLVRIFAASYYLTSLKHGLRLAHLIESKHPIDHPSINEATHKAIIESGVWNIWRILALVSAVCSAYLWWAFAEGVDTSDNLRVAFALVLSYVLVKGAWFDFAPDWPEEWYLNLVRVHDSNSMEFIRSRMVQIADTFRKRDIGEIELSALEVDKLNHELFVLLKQVSIIKNRNADLVD